MIDRVLARLAISALAIAAGGSSWAQIPPQWKAHDMNRPRPPVVAPPRLNLPSPAPPDALILFDGADLSEWQDDEGGPARWKAENGYMEAVLETGSILTRRGFGDVQLHVEWAAPPAAEGEGQSRGNSGVFLMSLYEVQILDSYQNETYADGQAAAVYGQYPPLANASLPPGQWQAYDIFFRRPRFDSDGALLQPARLTVIHNGILVQDGVQLWGPTLWLQNLPYEPHPEKLPLLLQNHDSPVRFRNIWLRELPEWASLGPASIEPEPVLSLLPAVLDRYVGKYEYELEPGEILTILREGNQLRAHFYGPATVELVAHSLHEFSLRWTAARLLFDLDSRGEPRGVTFHIGGERRVANRIE